jgi:hypothetical protein
MNAQLNILQKPLPNITYPPVLADARHGNFFDAEEVLGSQEPLEISIADVTVRQLTSMADISEIQYLRREINLELHRTLDPDFARHEKKEMN